MYNILFVCLGATCRSPMASVLFNKIASSRGLNCRANFCGLQVQYGSEVKAESKEAVKAYGVKRVCGKPTQIAGEHLANNNLIVCLAEDYKWALKNMSAPQFKDKIICFKDFCGQDISDPYNRGQQVYNQCCAQIYNGLNILIDNLVSQGIAKEKKQCSKK